MKVAIYSLLGLVGIGILGFVLTAYDFGMYKFWAPKQENVRREVFTNTQSYVQGKITALSNERLEYQTTTDRAQKDALRNMILTEAAQIQMELLPPELQAFIRSIE